VPPPVARECLVEEIDTLIAQIDKMDKENKERG
jgi:hypothetical protein